MHQTPAHRKAIAHRASIHQEKTSVLSDHECLVIVILATTALCWFHIDSPPLVAVILTASSDLSRFVGEVAARILDHLHK